jgi:hypothetical protein
MKELNNVKSNHNSAITIFSGISYCEVPYRDRRIPGIVATADNFIGKTVHRLD